MKYMILPIPSISNHSQQVQSASHLELAVSLGATALLDSKARKVHQCSLHAVGAHVIQHDGLAAVAEVAGDAVLRAPVTRVSPSTHCNPVYRKSRCAHLPFKKTSNNATQGSSTVIRNQGRCGLLVRCRWRVATRASEAAARASPAGPQRRASSRGPSHPAPRQRRGVQQALPLCLVQPRRHCDHAVQHLLPS